MMPASFPARVGHHVHEMMARPGERGSACSAGAVPVYPGDTGPA
jgi:hypothetical protein